MTDVQIETQQHPTDAPREEQADSTSPCRLSSRPHSWISCGDLGCRGY